MSLIEIVVLFIVFLAAVFLLNAWYHMAQINIDRKVSAFRAELDRMIDNASR